MRGDAFYRTHVRSRYHAHRRNRLAEAVEIVSFVLGLAAIVVIVPLLVQS